MPSKCVETSWHISRDAHHTSCIAQSAAKALEQRPMWAIAAQTLGRAQINFGEVLLAVDSFRHALHLHESAHWGASDPRSLSLSSAAQFAQRQCVLAFSHKPVEAAAGGAPSCTGGSSGGGSISNDALYLDPPDASKCGAYPSTLVPPTRPAEEDTCGNVMFSDWVSALTLANKWRRDVLPGVHAALAVQLSGLAQQRSERATVTGTRPDMDSACATDYPDGLLYKRATVK
jgi:hypothetical protein